MSYDRALTVFSPDGRLLQVDYANEAVKRGSCCIGVKGKDTVILAVEKRAVPTLQDERTVRKILQVDENVSLAFSGLAADARVLVNRARIDTQSYRLDYEVPPTVEWVARDIALLQQKYTQRGGSRPFGISVLVVGMNNDGEPELYQTDPNGTYYGWEAASIGSNSKTTQDFLEKNWQSDLDEVATKKLAIKTLLQICEASSDNMEVLVVKKGSTTYLSKEELDPLLKELDDTEERLAKLKAEK